VGHHPTVARAAAAIGEPLISERTER
jgi:hypothetical protein